MAKPASKKTAAASDSAVQSIRIEYYRSAICSTDKHRKVVRGLGFTHLRQVVVREDTPAVRGMVKAIPHLVRILA